jgi:hypothetical protein
MRSMAASVAEHLGLFPENYRMQMDNLFAPLKMAIDYTDAEMELIPEQRRSRRPCRPIF